MKPIKQIVYLPVEITEEFWKKYDSGEEKPDYEIIDANNGERIDEWINKQEGYFFTPEQLNEYTRNVGKAFLETAAENAKDMWLRKSFIDKESITNTFEETFKLFFVSL